MGTGHALSLQQIAQRFVDMYTADLKAIKDEQESSIKNYSEKGEEKKKKTIAEIQKAARAKAMSKYMRSQRALCRTHLITYLSPTYHIPYVGKKCAIIGR